MRRLIASVFTAFSCYLNSEAVYAQEVVRATVHDNSPIQIPTSPFNDSAAIHAQQEQMRLKGQMLDYGVRVATQCKTSLGDFQAKLAEAIATNSFEAAWKILAVGEQTVAQAEATDSYVFRYVNHSTDSPAGRAHSAADAELAAAKQTLAQMQAALVPEAKRELEAATKVQAVQDEKLKALAAQRQAAEEWDHKITGSLGEISACFSGDEPSSGVNCNVFVGRALEAVYGFSDFRVAEGRYLVANEIADFLVTSPNWTPIGLADSQTVLDDAANFAGSRPVVAVWRNPVPTKHGHVVLIGPGPLQPSGWILSKESNPVHLNVPNSAGFSMTSATARYIGDKLSKGFTDDQKSSVLIYVRANP